MSDPATGFIFANRVPEGNPSDPSYVLPLLDKVHSAIDCPVQFFVEFDIGFIGALALERGKGRRCGRC